MRRKKTFELKDLDKTFWDSVIAALIEHSSGMGGPGHISLITDDMTEYYIGVEGFPYSEYDLGEFADLFKRKEKIVDYKHPYVAEDNGWTYIREARTLIRNDYYTKFMEIYSKKEKNPILIHYIAKDVLVESVDAEKGLKTVFLKESVEIWEQQAEKMRELEEKLEKLKIDESYFDWKPVHPNNMKQNGSWGYYALLFKEQHGKIKGYKFSIMYQYKQKEPYCREEDIEFYNLFVNIYPDVKGPLSYPSNTRPASERPFIDTSRTFTDNDMNCPGEFLRAFRTIEEAKEYAVTTVNVQNYVNKENMIVNEKAL